MKLVQVRECDGQCCADSPRFPNTDHSDCIYHINGGCELMRNHNLIPDGDCPGWTKHTAVDAFVISCLQFPQNLRAMLGKTGPCCWQWIENGN